MEAEKVAIYASINAIMGEINPISKDKKNTQGSGFMYRGVDDVMNALQPALIKHKVFIVPEALEQSREERTTKSGGTLIYSICKVRYTFYAIDGSSIQAIVVGEGMDSGDKATNKAMSVAFKYACFQIFCIPTEETKDPDSESHEVIGNSKKITEAQLKVLNAKLQEKGVSADDVLKEYNVGSLANLSPQQFNGCISKLAKR